MVGCADMFTDLDKERGPDVKKYMDHYNKNIYDDMNDIAKDNDPAGAKAKKVKTQNDNFAKNNPGTLKNLKDIQENIFKKHYPKGTGFDEDKVCDCIQQFAQKKLPPPQKMDYAPYGWLVWMTLAQIFIDNGLDPDGKWKKLKCSLQIAQILDMAGELSGVGKIPAGEKIPTEADLKKMTQAEKDKIWHKVWTWGKGYYYALAPGLMPPHLPGIYATLIEKYRYPESRSDELLIMNAKGELVSFSEDHLLGSIVNKGIDLDSAMKYTKTLKTIFESSGENVITTDSIRYALGETIVSKGEPDVKRITKIIKDRISSVFD
jgi:hypothetical protein